MGCCQTHLAADNLRTLTKSHSILLKVPKKRLEKKVSFKVEAKHHKSLNIEETAESPLWYTSLTNSDISEWSEFIQCSTVIFNYSMLDGKLNTKIKIILNEIPDYESIVSLINNPKHRIDWDPNLLKMEIILGDPNLDATICLSEKLHGKIEVYERTVRKFKEVYMIYYSLLDKVEKDNYFAACIFPSYKIEIFCRETCKDLASTLKLKSEWALHLEKEILTHKEKV